jgi:hypothetical protein
VLTLAEPQEAIPLLAELFALVEALAVFPTLAPVVVVLVAVLQAIPILALEYPDKEIMVALQQRDHTKAVRVVAQALRAEMQTLIQRLVLKLAVWVVGRLCPILQAGQLHTQVVVVGVVAYTNHRLALVGVYLPHIQFRTVYQALGHLQRKYLLAQAVQRLAAVFIYRIALLVLAVHLVLWSLDTLRF